MIRQTSFDAYNEIKSSGDLSRRQMEVYEVIFSNGPLTQNELHQWFFKNTQPRTIQPRVSELEKMGVVACVGTRPCKVTGKTCLTWDVTGQSSKPYLKPETSKQKIGRLEQEIRVLRNQLNEAETIIKRIPQMEMSL